MPIDNSITKRLNEWLAKTDRTFEDVISGATLLLQLNRNRQLFQTVMTNPKHFESTVVYELKKFVPIRQRGQTLEDVQNDAKQLLGELKTAVNEEPAENDSKDDSEKDLPMHGGKRPDHDSLPDNIKAIWPQNAERWKKIKSLYNTCLGITEPCDLAESLNTLKETWYKYKSEFARYDDFIVENNDETPENNIVVVDDQPYKVVIVNANQPTGYEFTNYIPEVPSQGDVETKTVGNVPGYNVEISNTETVAHMKEQLLTLDERLEVARGKNVDFTIEFNDGESAVSPAVKAKVEATIGSGTIAKWLDISVFKQLEGAEKTPVEKPNGKMKLQISVPDDILALAASGAQFELICVVDGEVVRIPATYNAETNTIDFETAVFGVFALVYTA